MYNKREREQYNAHRDAVCEALEITKNQYNYLRRLAEACHKVYENDCNGLYEEQESYNERNKAEVRVVNYLGEIMSKRALDNPVVKFIYSHFQTDPRGATLYIDIKPIPENNYTSAYCIY